MKHQQTNCPQSKRTMHTLVTHFFRASQDNAHGIIFMREGKYNEAVQFFRSGLETLVYTAATSASHPASNYSYSELLQNKSHQNIQRITSVEVVSTESDQAGAGDDVFLLYDRALDVSVNVDDIQNQSHFCRQLLYVSLMYNIGLAHHLEGISSGRSFFLENSLAYYTIAYKEVVSRKTNSEFPGLAHMALVNNIGHVHAHFRNLSATELCCDELAYQLVARNPSQEERQPFCSNALFFHENQLAGAPAA